MSNNNIAKILKEIADYLEMDEVQFKPQAYRKAARAVASLDKKVESLYQEEGIKGLKEISGIGEGIAKKIEELVKTGKLDYYEEIKKKAPVNLSELTAIEGVGPKTVKTLYDALGIKSVEDLEKAGREGKIRGVEGFGKKSEEDILQGIEFLKGTRDRFILGFVMAQVEEIKDKLKKLEKVGQIEIAGSYRRKKETIGDIDILITSNAPKKVMGFFVNLEDVVHCYNHGQTKSSVRLANGMDCDLRVVNKKSFGSALQYFTGSKDHNIAVRKIAQEQGYKLNEYGVFKNDKQIAGKTEKEVYKALGFPYIEPELRTNSGEIKAAQKGKLPKIIGYEDIKGDLQMHSTWSDGSNSISEMAKAAKGLGHKYIAITDHSQSLRVAGGLSPKDFKKQWAEIEKVNKEIKNFRILKGAEVDILEDGSLDLPDKTLKKLDIAFGAIHSKFKLPQSQQTKRLIKAMENPYIDIIAHPTGRVIQRRKAYALDMDKIFKKACKTGTILEINSYPNRLDIKDVLAREALRQKVKLTINTDSHHVNHLRYMSLGIAQARRGWATKKDVLNTLPVEQFLRALPKR